jgi:mono/diheme cytochrome c family protein
MVFRRKMKSMNWKITPLILTVGLLSACGTQPAATPSSTSQPTEVVVPATEIPATTVAVPTDTAQPTEAPASEPAPATGVSFASDVSPILNSRCVNCHGGDRVEEGLILRSYSDLIAGSDNGPVITPGSAADSLLVELISNQKMPKRGPKLTPPQVQLIADWVNQGALDN